MLKWQGSRRMDLLTALRVSWTMAVDPVNLYTVSSGRDLKIKGYSLMADQMETFLQEKHAMLERKFGNKLIRYKWVGYILYSINSRGDLWSIHAWWFCRCWYHSLQKQLPSFELYSRSRDVKARPTQWQEYLDRLMPREHKCTDNHGKTFPQQDYLRHT